MIEAALRIKESVEIEFLKSKTYTEINQMFNQLNDKLQSEKQHTVELKQRHDEMINRMEHAEYVLKFALEVIEDKELDMTYNSDGWVLGRSIEDILNKSK